jgi:hypothetical protein
MAISERRIASGFKLRISAAFSSIEHTQREGPRSELHHYLLKGIYFTRNLPFRWKKPSRPS